MFLNLITLCFLGCYWCVNTWRWLTLVSSRCPIFFPVRCNYIIADESSGGRKRSYEWGLILEIVHKEESSVVSAEVFYHVIASSTQIWCFGRLCKLMLGTRVVTSLDAILAFMCFITEMPVRYSPVSPQPGCTTSAELQQCWITVLLQSCFSTSVHTNISTLACWLLIYQSSFSFHHPVCLMSYYYSLGFYVFLWHCYSITFTPSIHTTAFSVFSCGHISWLQETFSKESIVFGPCRQDHRGPWCFLVVSRLTRCLRLVFL